MIPMDLIRSQQGVKSYPKWIQMINPTHSSYDSNGWSFESMDGVWWMNPSLPCKKTGWLGWLTVDPGATLEIHGFNMFDTCGSTIVLAYYQSTNQKLKYRHNLTITTTMVPGFYWIVKAFGFLRSPVFRHSLGGTSAHPLLGISVLASSQKEGKLTAADVQKGVIPVRQLYNKMNQHDQHDNDMWWIDLQRQSF